MQTCKPHKSTLLKSHSIQIYEFHITMECIIYRSILRCSCSLAKPFVSSILSSIAIKMIQKVLRAKQLWFTVQLQVYKFLSCSNIHFPCGSCDLAKTHNLPVSRKQQRKCVQLLRLLGNALSKTLCDFWVYCTTFSGFLAFITDYRSITKHGSSVKPNLSLHNINLSLTPYQKCIKTTMATQ